MFSKILIAIRGDNSRQAIAANPDRMVRAARAGEIAPQETPHV